MEVLLIFRKKNPLFYSIERVFQQVIKGWQQEVKIEQLVLPAMGISFTNLRYLFGRQKKSAAEVFHITGDVHYCVFALPRKKTLLTIHDCVFIEQQKGWKRWVLKKLLLDWPVAYLTHLSTISEKSKQEIVALTQCNPAKITVIPNPVAEGIYCVEKPFNKVCPVLLFIGSTPNKNLERVAEAIDGISCSLRVIGKLTDAQVQLLNERGISFTARAGITDSELAEEYAQADIVLFPSLYEGFGLPVIEGFKAGRVVVTSNIAPMKDNAADAACLVDPCNAGSIRSAVQKVTDEDEYRNMLIARGKEKVKKFGAAEIAKQYTALYQKIAN